MSRLIGYIPPIHTEELPLEEHEHEEVKMSVEDCAEEAAEGAEPDGGTEETPAPKKTARKKQSE